MDLRKQHDLADRLEACRPDSSDIAQEAMHDAAAALAANAELARQFDQQQQYDAALSQTMQRVEAPAGLADRILARLSESASEQSIADSAVAQPLSLDSEFTAAEQAATESGTPDAAAPATVDNQVAPAKPATPRRPTRRKVMVGLVSLAASLLLAVTLVQWWTAADTAVTAEEFQKQALRWETVKTDAWQTDMLGFQELEQQYPLQHLLVSPTGYQVIDPQLADTQQQMAVYNFTSRRGEAYLFVAQTQYGPPSLVAGAPPSQADQLTAGWSMAAWREGPLLYVLLHRGGPHQYDQLIDTPDAIAMNTRVFSRGVGMRCRRSGSCCSGSC